MIDLILKKGKERSLLRRHPWVYDTAVQKLSGKPANGETVCVRNADKRFLARAAYSEASTLRARCWSFDENEMINRDWIAAKIEKALAARAHLFERTSAVRVIFGEADHFPGLTVDRFNDILVAQTLSLGIEVRKELIFNLLYKILREQGEEIRGLYERNDVKIRLLEGMEENKGWFAFAEAAEPGEPLTEIVENGIRYNVDVENGQKTGFFLDQKYNRQAIAKIARGKHVLDCFTHTGAFALNAAVGGAASVTAVDISAEAVQMTDANASKNGLDKVVKGLKANVFDLLSELVNNKSREYDFIILDPPAFTKSGSTVKNAIRGYKEINLKAMKLLPRGGYLATCSCSHFMKEELFVQMLHDAAADANVQLRQIEARQQSPDHPILWNVPETYYLKFYIFQVV